ncbi:calcium-dependent phospholipid-binding Copine family protein [Actinidia rufa]|uniref:Calcium-dependent phospholipid-binding Copine family protein n=1 Tax=Actinidia rufa TaxID=165716 RepID=A0A7J0GM54_9ERIC|nr:calcium-dependent phospholipid-binding Copine family protein [Actinidia rufa]
MGNCCSDVAGGRAAIGGGASSQTNPAGGPNDAVDFFLTSRGYRGLFSQIEVLLSLYFIVLHIDSHKSLSVCVYWWRDLLQGVLLAFKLIRSSFFSSNRGTGC